ncbi:hypothetical protein J2Y48_003421 [Mycoplana sp. BE70]|uniref:hypothetical protein n=1 Tax=Mycoplana sp. BE70 TaxID=2817775 RepID=UPI0028564679|nr:hypothetical protein [Mycoplana sp. BE70]MDR6758123.1 hypothetical protein [Mycoplana sp. BE70]
MILSRRLIGLLMAGWDALFLDNGLFEPDPAHHVEWNRGAHLVRGAAHCGTCHTPRNLFMAGGDVGRWHAPNITSDPNSGIGGWTKAVYLKTVQPLPTPSGSADIVDPQAIIRAVQDEVFPLDVNYFRTHAVLSASLKRLDRLWKSVSSETALDESEAFRLRQAQAMTATARFMYSAALLRTETRGMHRRDDFPTHDPAQHHRLIVSGVDTITVRQETIDPGVYREAAKQ